VVVNDTSLSRQHARFTWNGKEVKVEDLGSTNGTWFGEEPVETATVHVGQELTLGAVMAAIQSPAGAAATELGLDSHDRFMALLETEIVRAKFFGRPFSVAMIRALQPSARHLRHWAPALRARLRPVDRAALYSPDVLEIAIQEIDADQAREVLEKLMSAADPAHDLVAGLSTFPSSANTPESVLETARTALLRADSGERLCVAPVDRARTLEHIRTPSDVICESPAMRRALDLAQRLARGVIPVLLHGETGSGKEVLARFIHESGPRSDKPLVAVNSAAIPAQLLESILFGHEKGAFTGATQRQAGVFEAAHGGSVFLDEIGELPLEAQASLLRVLETKHVTRIGSTKEIPIDARILAASHRDLEALVEEGRFRADLFYRLNAITLPVPALRERREDIAALARHFLQLANAANGTNIASIDEDALDALQNHQWPGNVRELRNVIERGVVIAEHATLTLHDLPQALRNHMPRALPLPASLAHERNRCQPGEDFRACMERIEAEVLIAALDDAQWNKSETARRLQMPRRTLVHKIRVHRIKPSEPKE
jgi:DNA-binding NtrC family response regulator